MTRSWEKSALGEDIGEDIVNRLFISEVSTQTPEFINCLRHIARAGASLTARHGRDNPIGTLIKWFGIGVTLIKAGPWANPTTTEDFTVGQTQSTLVGIANNRGERDQMAAGYMKAAAYFNTCVHETPSGSEFITYATGEALIGPEWTAPSSQNFLWDLLGKTTLSTEVQPMLPQTEISAFLSHGGLGLHDHGL